MDTKKYKDLVISHYRECWGSAYKIKRWDKGPMKDLSQEFCLLEYPPNNKRKMWTYATCCMSSFEESYPIELHVFSSTKNDTILEILTAISYYHKKEEKLNLNHTVNFGIPWRSDSKCNYGFISLPYLDGPNLELLKTDYLMNIHFYWLIPITPEELNYKKLYGVESLEKKFDESKFDYSNPLRKSII